MDEKTTLKPNALSKEITSFFKGVAIILVVLVHSVRYFDLPFYAKCVQNFGQMGCQIFFLISAFGLNVSFSRNPCKWKNFVLHRLSKLSISWWAAILVFAVYRLVIALVNSENPLAAVDLPGIAVNAVFLNGVVPFGNINNAIVRGGWFVGTIVILYALFPLLHRIYNIKKENWEKHRVWLFPLIVASGCSVVMILAWFIHPYLGCGNNTFMYFSFVNQLPAFVLGFSLYDLLVVRKSKAKWSLPLFAVMMALSLLLFFKDFKYSFVFVPTTVSVAWISLIAFFVNNKKCSKATENKSNIIVKTVMNFGKYSFPIYLTHSFVVYDFSEFALRLLSRVYENDTLWYFVLLPIVFVAVYCLGRIFDLCTTKLQQIFKPIKK
ncbi:MAG: acyltransferase [Ruminococcaceae bacterium]|nr:acyltransferase [Oscillospiraceae bacterium]